MRNTEPTATGNLKQTPFAHLLLYVQERRQSGTLHVRWGSRAREDAVWLYIRSGVICRLRAPVPERDMATALAPLCARDQGTYAYYATIDLVGGRPDVMEGTLDPRALLTRALRLGAREDSIALALASLGDHLLQLKGDIDLEPYAFNGSELGFVRRLAHQPRSLQELERTAGMPGSMARRIIYLLRATRALALLPAGRHVTSGTVQLPAAPAARAMVSQPVVDLRRAPASVSGAMRARWTEIVTRSEQIGRENFFEMLGLDSSAGSQDVQRAFAQAAKLWHPDRVPPELGPLQERVREIFALLTQARDALSNPATRLEHLTDIDAGGGTPETRYTVANALKADTVYQKALVLMRCNRYDEALTMVRQALVLDGSQADYLALCAWLTHQAEDEPSRVSMAVERMLQDALLQDERCERAHHYRALIYKQCGRQDEALEHFKTALTLNPKNMVAERELRVARMRSQQAETQPLLKRLFSKRPPWKKTGSS